MALDLGRAEESLAAFTRALAVAEKLGEEGVSMLVVARTGVGKSLLALDRAGEAVAPLEQALAWRLARDDVPAHQIGGNRFALARALWQSGGSRTRARELAKDAEEDFKRAAAGMAGKPGPLATAHDLQVARATEVAAWRKEH